MYAAEKQYIVDTLTMYISLCLVQFYAYDYIESNVCFTNLDKSSLTYYIISYIEVTDLTIT